jgi:hypothetical protein
VSRLPKFFAARAAIEEALSALSRASVQLRAEGESQQHPMYYRANQFWRQLDEFRVEIDRCAQANTVGTRAAR